VILVLNEKVSPPLSIQALKGAVGRAKDGEAINLLQVRQSTSTEGEDGGTGFTGEYDVDEAAERRVVGLHTLSLAGLVEGKEVVILRTQDGLSLGVESLNDNLSGLGASTSTTCDLAQKLEGALGGPEVRKVE
jgi:hypothetical protein